MAEKALKSIKFPGIADTYTIPIIDSTLSIEGAAADAKAVADAIQTIQGGGAIGSLPDMTGILPIAKGGTNATTTTAARYNLLSDLVTTSTAIDSATEFVIGYTSPDSTNGAILKAPAWRIQNYIRVFSETEPTPVAGQIWLKPIN